MNKDLDRLLCEPPAKKELRRLIAQLDGERRPQDWRIESMAAEFGGYGKAAETLRLLLAVR